MDALELPLLADGMSRRLDPLKAAGQAVFARVGSAVQNAFVPVDVDRLTPAMRRIGLGNSVTTGGALSRQR